MTEQHTNQESTHSSVPLTWNDLDPQRHPENQPHGCEPAR